MMWRFLLSVRKYLIRGFKFRYVFQPAESKTKMPLYKLSKSIFLHNFDRD